ncbi:MAG: capsular polysaccharide biosynthesis protein [Rhodobacterales bacterium]|nr:capsular polysaccharide biosynthesis protein [Rhodobacterales bacterium]
MRLTSHRKAAAGSAPRRLYYYNAGFLRQKRIRRILALAGYDLRLGVPSKTDDVAVWGHSPYAARGEAIAKKTGAALVRIEDAFLRSLHTGRSGEPPLGLLVDHSAMHFNSERPSDLERMLASDPLDDTHILNRARGAVARLKEAHISKYNAFDPSLPCPDPGYVLVIDQTRDDASVKYSRADANTFREMLYYAQEEHPHAHIIIKTHPETAEGHRAGYFDASVETDNIVLFDTPVSPWHLFEGATAVYTVSSQLGFEAIMAGHRPIVFGQPFYSGWGLTDDRNPVQRRQRVLTRAQLFAAAMIKYPIWYDPHRDQLCEIETVIDILEARARAWREDRHGWVAAGMALWKRAPLQKFFGQVKKIRFNDALPASGDRRAMVWASKSEPDRPAIRVEDGFLRSRGLGADLIPPLSLVCDDLGIYYDPRRMSRLEQLIGARATLRMDQQLRSEALITDLISFGLSKYNLAGALPELPEVSPHGTTILVPGQVEDDASILAGTDHVNTNLALLQATRNANPDAIILYKPHPDVEAGLRYGQVPADALEDLADAVLTHTDPMAVLEYVDEVWTMTSGLGFEALLRGLSVTTVGAPFYAGWGLTRDLGKIPSRRTARPDIAGLVHATLIDYPRYFDPVTNAACPVEVIVDRLAHGSLPRPSFSNRLIAKLQGSFASYAHLWR